VEDYILLATVDGHLYAADRESGDERWHLQVEQPVVETIHYRPNTSSADGSRKQDRHPLDDYVWAIEPNNNGAVYVWTPSHFGAGLMSTGYTMKQLVDEMGHYASSDPPVVYTGQKKNTLITVDAATGRVVGWFGQAGAQVDQTCFPPNGRLLDSDMEECSDSGTITLSRTEYTVDIHRRDDGRGIATLRYAEWGPNNLDNDLHQQYRSTPDNRYFTSQHDGRVYAISHPASITSFALEFSVPVARVFDVARPQDVPSGINPELVLLPQPMAPARDEDSAWARSHSVFLNQTSSGGWYAMSGRSYPLIVDGPSAQINRRSSWENDVLLDSESLPAALVGVHTLGDGIGMPEWSSGVPPSLPAESFSETERLDVPEQGDPFPTTVPEFETELPQIGETVKMLPRYARDWIQDLFKNPLVIVILVYAAYRYYSQIRRASLVDYLKTPTFVQPTNPSHQSPTQVVEETKPAVPNVDEKTTVSSTDKAPVTVQEVEPALPLPDLEVTAGNLVQQEQPTEPESPDKKKKAHRGRRGGVKHRKGAKKQQDASDESPRNGSPETIEGIPGLQNVGIPPKLEPNVTTLINDPEDVSGPIVNIGGIEVNQDCQLGMGSNGTVVFAGKFHGRDVAVKRMLTQFWEIATQETQLLLESDHHQNGKPVFIFFCFCQTGY
jgi:serine/threonine-protein kinase/endoribonuclease IRE1